MAYFFSPIGNTQIVDANGNPLVGGTIETYLAGTSTPRTTYTDDTGGTQQGTSMTLSSLGYPENGPVWMIGGVPLKFIIKNAAGVTQSTFDDVVGIGDVTVSADQFPFQTSTPTYISATSFSVIGDQTTELHAGRRLKSINAGGTVYSTILSSAFLAGVTTVTVLNTSGVLDSDLSQVNYSLLTATNPAVPAIPITSYMLGATALGESMVNGILVASVSSNALTIAIKTKAGADPTALDPVLVLFRNTTAATGDYTVLTLTAATSFVVSSGSTMGTTSAVISRLWVVGFNDAGTFRLGAINCRDSTLSIFPLSDAGIVSSTAEGGAGAADSAGVFYTGTAVASKAYAILGYVESTQATAGTWATAPSFIQLFGPGVHKPGEVVQRRKAQVSTASTGTTIIPYDNTIPQITEGNEYMTQVITPTSLANMLNAITVIGLASSGNTALIAALFQDSNANALAAMSTEARATDTACEIVFSHDFAPGTVAATTLRVRAGGPNAGTTTFNGISGVGKLGGVLSSSLSVSEIMA